MHPRVVPLDGRALLLQVKDSIEADLRSKVEAVEVSTLNLIIPIGFKRHHQE